MAKSNKEKTDESKSSDSSKLASVNPENNIPTVELSYQGRTYPMLPFVVVEGQDVKKLNFPQLPDDYQPVVKIPQGESFSLVFDSQPRDTNALVIDYDADVTAVSPVNKLGTDSFSVSSVTGPHTLEIRAVYPDDRYVTYTLLVDIEKGQSLSLANSPENPQTRNDFTTTNMQNESPEGEPQIKSIQALNYGENGSTADTIDNRIANVYGAMLNEGSLVKPGPTVFDSQEHNSNDGCLVNEIPIRTMNTNDNVTLSNSPNGSNNNDTKAQSAPWVQADLGTEKQVCGVKVQLKLASDEVKFFTVELSTNGTSYTPPKYFSNTGSDSSGEIYNFGKEPITARYIKLTELGKSGGDAGWITDLKVLGTNE
jgi:hypothetical protein